MENLELDQEKYEKVFGEEYGKLFSYLKNEVFEINYRFQEHVELYGTNFSRIEKVLAVSASSFFGLLYSLMFDDLTLRIARLSDKKEISGNKNVSIESLYDLKHSDDTFHKNLKIKIDSFRGIVGPLKIARNKSIAHLDYKSNILSHQNFESIAMNRNDIKKCLASLIDIMNFVENEFLDSTTEYEVVVQDGASDLLWTLYEGLRFKANRQTRLTNRQELEDYEDEEKNPINF